MKRHAVLLGALLLACGAGTGGVPPATAPVLPSPAGDTAPDADLRRLEQEILAAVNEHRVVARLEPLQDHPGIAAIARRHSRAMAAGGVLFDHTGLDDRARAVRGKMTYTRLAENLAYNTARRPATVAWALDGWLRSEGHRRNLEGRWHFTGIGVAQRGRRYYYTQIFVAVR